MKAEELTKMVIENAKILSRVEQKQDDFGERLCGFEEKVISELRDIKNNYVTKSEFLPVKSISFGIVGTVLTIILSALIYSVII